MLCVSKRKGRVQNSGMLSGVRWGGPVTKRATLKPKHYNGGTLLARTEEYPSSGLVPPSLTICWHMLTAKILLPLS